MSLALADVHSQFTLKVLIRKKLGTECVITQLLILSFKFLTLRVISSKVSKAVSLLLLRMDKKVFLTARSRYGITLHLVFNRHPPFQCLRKRFS